jgi:hypothetical protein
MIQRSILALPGKELKEIFLISDVSANNTTLHCRQHAARELRVEHALFKLLGLPIKLP